MSNPYTAPASQQGRNPAKPWIILSAVLFIVVVALIGWGMTIRQSQKAAAIASQRAVRAAQRAEEHAQERLYSELMEQEEAKTK